MKQTSDKDHARLSKDCNTGNRLSLGAGQLLRGSDTQSVITHIFIQRPTILQLATNHLIDRKSPIQSKTKTFDVKSQECQEQQRRCIPDTLHKSQMDAWEESFILKDGLCEHFCTT